jgi:hypothetical protein
MVEIEFREELDKGAVAIRRRLVILSIIAFVVAFASIWTIRFFSENGKDTWVCHNGEWVQVGHPVNPPPKWECAGGPERSKSTSDDKELMLSGNSVVFVQKGSLVKGLPGLNPGKIYLAYDNRGIRTETIALEFDEKSLCALGDDITPCSDPRIDNGLRVRIRGQRTSSGILVQELETLDADEL